MSLLNRTITASVYPSVNCFDAYLTSFWMVIFLHIHVISVVSASMFYLHLNIIYKFKVKELLLIHGLTI